MKRIKAANAGNITNAPINTIAKGGDIILYGVGSMNDVQIFADTGDVC